LLGDDDYVPVIEFMRDVFDGVFVRFLLFDQLSHILEQLNIDLSQSVH